MTTCAPTSEVGLSRIGFISTCGSIPAACACIACARPISWPSRVAKELSDMFWALNGATLNPSCRKILHRAATVSDFPACDAVPKTINATLAIVPYSVYSGATFVRRGVRLILLSLIVRRSSVCQIPYSSPAYLSSPNADRAIVAQQQIEKERRAQDGGHDAQPDLFRSVQRPRQNVHKNQERRPGQRAGGQ